MPIKRVIKKRVFYKYVVCVDLNWGVEYRKVKTYKKDALKFRFKDDVFWKFSILRLNPDLRVQIFNLMNRSLNKANHHLDINLKYKFINEIDYRKAFIYLNIYKSCIYLLDTVILDPSNKIILLEELVLLQHKAIIIKSKFCKELDFEKGLAMIFG